MNIENLIIELIKSQKDNSNCDKISRDKEFFEIGKNYLIRTVTMTLTGKLEGITDKEFLLSSACWIADTGLFNQSLKTEKFEEVEPFIKNVIVNRASLIDATEINKLPAERK